MAFTAGTPLSASALNDAVGYTAPTTFTTTTPAGAGWYRKVGSLIEVHYESTGTVAGTTAVAIVTLPVGYRPAGLTALGSATLSTTRPGAATVDASGQLTIYNWNPSPAIVECHGLFAPA